MTVQDIHSPTLLSKRSLHGHRWLWHLFRQTHLALLVLLFLVAPSYSQPGPAVRIAKIVDGDTVQLAFPWGKESVRLIGIDTPESRENQRAYRQVNEYGVSLKTILSLGKDATRHLENLAPRGTFVSVEYDQVKRDRYGRQLAYLFLSNGVMLNKQMIDDGLAAPLSIKPNTRYAAAFYEGAEIARQDRRGIWQHLTLRSSSPPLHLRKKRIRP